MTGATPVVACLRHEPVDTLGVGEPVLRDQGISVRNVDLWTGDRPPDIDSLSGLILLGGEMNVDEEDRYPFLTFERALIRSSVARGLPTLGICLGGQLIARAFGAAVHEGAAVEAGFYPVRATEDAASDPLLSSFAADVPVFRWHRDGFDVPDGATLLLKGSDISPNQAFRVGVSCWALQFHPEVTAELFEQWMAGHEEEVERDYGRKAAALVADVRANLDAQQRAARLMFGRFAAEVRSYHRAIGRAGTS